MSFLGKTIGKIVGHSNRAPSPAPHLSSSSSSSPSQHATSTGSTSSAHATAATNSSSSSIVHHPSSSFGQHASTAAHQDAQLTLTHLRKVFYEYMHPKQQHTQAENEERLYNILPLFIKVNIVLYLPIQT
jgi:hypothetical protein